MKAVNWNRPDDDFTMMFWNQNIMQFWTDEEIPLSDDKMSWMTLSDAERELYMKVLGGLTLLDTVQGGVGMPKILEHVDGLQRKAVLGFMGMMEQIHAKSYSSIFTTLATTEEIDGSFRWVENNEYLQYKADTVAQYYIHKNKESLFRQHAQRIPMWSSNTLHPLQAALPLVRRLRIRRLRGEYASKRQVQADVTA